MFTLNKKSKSTRIVLLATVVITSTLMSITITSAAPQSLTKQQQKAISTNYNNAVENLLADESSRNDEIEDDLTAADLDLDGAAATSDGSDSDNDPDGDDSSAADASESELRWLENNNNDNAFGNTNNEPHGLDTNIENARINMSPKDMATAAGHHHHHGHYPHGWLKMGAETGKKGAFKWHDKHPVGGKGRR